VNDDELEPGEILELRERVRARLLAIPGVLGVGYGLKEVGDELTERRALRVYVDEKRPLSDLAPDEVIPDEIEGVPTDVVRIPRVVDHGTEDKARHSPLLGGITITNNKPDSASQISLGTLGCFATIDGAGGPDNVVLLSNNHVLAANAGAVGDGVHQPQVGGITAGSPPEPIGTIHNIGVAAPRNFTYPSETQQAYFIDCATAKLAIDVSSWCDCNCGVSYKNELREINVGGNKLEGVARAVDGETVYKSGRSTGGTQGTIADPLGSAMHGTPPVLVNNVILISPANPPDPKFSDHGDSGAAVINAQRKIVGLVFGGEDGVPNPTSVACHIAPVLDLLKITPISTANPPVGPAGQARSSRLATVVGSPGADAVEDHTVELQGRLRGTEAGRRLYDAFLLHRSEVVGLVNRHRPVTIAWHRGKGPTYFAHVAENARHPGHRIPFEVEGVSRTDLLERMAQALLEAGSAPLRAAVERHRDEVLALVDDFDDLHELVGRFEEDPAHV
jgi:hypothetical protein